MFSGVTADFGVLGRGDLRCLSSLAYGCSKLSRFSINFLQILATYYYYPSIGVCVQDT